MKNSSLLLSTKHEQRYGQTKHEQMHRKTSLILEMVLVPCLPLHVLTTQWLIFYPSLVYGSSWFIFKRYGFLHSPLTEKEDRELYFAIFPFRESAFTLTPFSPANPNTANWCKEIITAQFGLFLQRYCPTHMAPEHNPKFTLSKDLGKIQVKCSTASSTSSSQDPSLSCSCDTFCTQLKTSYHKLPGQKDTGHRSCLILSHWHFASNSVKP